MVDAEPKRRQISAERAPFDPANRVPSLGVTALRTADRSSEKRGHRWIFTVPDLRRRGFVLVILLATGCICLAQTAPQALQADEQPSTISGTVVNAVTGAPVARALVMTP